MSEKPFGLSVKIVLLDQEGRVLFLKRSMRSKGNPGKWDFPGGKIDPGESFDRAVLREVIEETGLTISIEGAAGTAQSETETHRVIYLILQGQLVNGSVQLSEEHDDFAWVSIDQLRETDVAEQFRAFVQEFARKRGGSA